MKHKPSYILAFTLLSVVLLVGCLSGPPTKLDKTAYGTQTLSTPPSTSQVISTNVTIDPVTGSKTSTLSTNAVTVPGTTITILVPRPEVTGALSALGASPIPYASPIAGVLGLIYTAYAAYRNKKIKGVLVDNVEQLGDALSTASPSLYDSVIKEVISHQAVSGVRESIIPIVQART